MICDGSYFHVYIYREGPETDDNGRRKSCHGKCLIFQEMTHFKPGLEEIWMKITSLDP